MLIPLSTEGKTENEGKREVVVDLVLGGKLGSFHREVKGEVSS